MQMKPRYQKQNLEIFDAFITIKYNSLKIHRAQLYVILIFFAAFYNFFTIIFDLFFGKK